MGVQLLKFTAPTAIALVLFMVSAAPAMGGAGTTTDSSENHRPPELQATSPIMRSDYETAKRLMRHQHYADAIPHLEFALADKPKDVHILNDLGYAKRMVGDYDSALDYYQRALAIDPNFTGAHQNLGEFYLAKNDLASAQKELATLATLCPSGCNERDALANAIKAYKPMAPPASDAAAQPPAKSAAATSSNAGGQP